MNKQNMKLEEDRNEFIYRNIAEIDLVANLKTKNYDNKKRSNS